MNKNIINNLNEVVNNMSLTELIDFYRDNNKHHPCFVYPECKKFLKQRTEKLIKQFADKYNLDLS